jgi:23S rRNA (guanosine2251-2'-O)-methyltransferase
VGGPKEQTFWLYGSHAVLAALANSHRRCRRLLVTAEAWRRNRDNLETLLQSRPELPVEKSERDQLDGLLPESSSHQGIALEVEPLSAVSLDAFLSGRRHSTPEKVETPDDEQADKKGEIVVVLDQIEDPRNLGAILRSAAAFRVDALILQDRHSPPESATMAKAASGGLERVAMIRVPNLARALEALRKAGYWCLGLDQGGEAPLSGFAPGQKTALVLGAEGQGLRRLTRQACDIHCRLPTDPAFPVLNVSNAAAIALYELRRGSRGH